MKTHYQILGITKGATPQRVKQAYRTLVKACHPDLFSRGSAAQAEAEEQIRKVNAAYAVLSNLVKRASYDAKINKQVSSAEPTPEHCGKCGKPTLYWKTDRNVAHCDACGSRAMHGM